MRLASRGYSVLAVDFSDSVVERAQETISDAGLSDRIDVRQESILELGLADDSQDYVICWGVLMHIPEVEKAVAELARVTAPGGWIVVSEEVGYAANNGDGRYWARTSDLQLVELALSQLS